MKADFVHHQSAHCESGVTSGLLQNAGATQITEPLAFGIGAGLFYAYIPLIKINNGPAIAFRTFPGLIFKRTCKALGIPVIQKKFRSKEQAENFLKEALQNKQPVGCQVGVYYLSYFPKEYRFHFNAHNLVVFGQEGDNYLISDPIMETPTSLTSYELERVRFAKGALAPKGQIYYPAKHVEVNDDTIRRAIKHGIKQNINNMLRIPGWFAGVEGIRYTGKRIKKWRDNLGLQKAGLYLAQLVRMQEEIGTGGGGFRYMYGAFLQEADNFLPGKGLSDISKQFTEAGDLWRTAAVQAAGIYKGRIGSQKDFDVMSNHLLQIADIEEKAFKALNKIKW
ncbi:BtrH N-terminal domain-containing protein [Mucilaginibacter ginkgonis]|uniref:BtrH N-terminal domain-containing protein n=1 Tax=Mucilaginibacter ginkgonis TaxID=2682091 RepID=A0A6I4HZ76_9SPHI|nr:BtrH N-terminal domain-containing protein [Mucilaginibacter ginkgonis]QQL49394.1 BtrH N-terminal domain-containing protein [Mucilaginibacter ginkgonis]